MSASPVTRPAPHAANRPRVPRSAAHPRCMIRRPPGFNESDRACRRPDERGGTVRSWFITFPFPSLSPETPAGFRKLTPAGCAESAPGVPPLATKTSEHPRAWNPVAAPSVPDQSPAGATRSMGRNRLDPPPCTSPRVSGANPPREPGPQALQQAPGGMGRPCGQALGCPSARQMASSTSGLIACSNTHAFDSIRASSTDRRSLRRFSARR